MRFDLHTHTTYSRHHILGCDAINTPREMVKAAVKKGLSGIAVTDHQVVKGSLVAKEFAKKYKKDFKVITGLEIKTQSGDILALGVKKNIPDNLTIENTVEKINNLGGLSIAAHPYGEFGLRTCVKDEAVKADAIEVFNASSCRGFQNKKAKELAKKYKKPIAAGSDAHYWKIIGNAGILCNGNPLEAIRKKKVKIFGHYTPLKDIAVVGVKKTIRSIKWKLKSY